MATGGAEVDSTKKELVRGVGKVEEGCDIPENLPNKSLAKLFSKVFSSLSSVNRKP